MSTANQSSEATRQIMRVFAIRILQAAPDLEWVEIVTSSGERVRVEAAEAAALRQQPLGPWHSEDYRVVLWGGRRYAFSPKQAQALKLLWEAWERAPDPAVSTEALLKAAGSVGSRVVDLFGRTPAWKEEPRLIIPTPGQKGWYQLADPPAS